ncbi:MAG: biopolymer transporter ExbD [Verrucomicrobia bacterium]|nr:biopolymer transporter ExbD [Verrucomicrobiota bacterium]
MRRFSQRNSLVTLSDINITPLLDLAFVLLIIFVITTPLLEQGLDLKLSQGGRTDRPVEKGDIRTVEIAANGIMAFGGRPMTLDQIEASLVRDFHANPNLLVWIRADENGQNKHLYSVIDRCQRNGITRFSLRTTPPR